MMRNPVFESSMKRRMRSFRAPLLITLYILFLLLVCGSALLTLQQDSISLNNLRSGLEAYVYLSIMQFALIVLVAPALTAGAISGERERQTLDLLLCTRVNAIHIVLGKLLSSTAFLTLMIVCSLPVMAVTMFFGGVGFLDVLLMALFLFITALACCAIGIFYSAIFKRTVTATVVSYLTIFALGVGTLIFPLIFQMDGMSKLNDIVNGTPVNGIVLTGTSLSSMVMSSIPKMFFINPALGLFSMLVGQTGMLQETFSSLLGWRGGQVFTLIRQIDNVVYINMAVLLVCTIILTIVAALFVKPGGRKAKKKK